MREELQALKEQALAELEAVTTPDGLKDLRIKYLGKKGPMTEILRGMGALPAEERPKIGQIVNEVKSTLEAAINAKTVILEAEALKARLANEKVDITLPGRTQSCGHLHPVTLTLREIKKIFMRMGFDVMEGPEIESDYYNFEALNLPQDHPARDMQDTFY
ncbi:MAG: phenylalanine--tRNA ligase subunit alpha, partial [Acidaminococcaceae bacterium]|nr:phenylalanine--tRNA ligase subunit alpha [Acidaminococcaceae bacterium]